MSDMTNKFQCPYCHRNNFGDENARYQHAKAAHRGKPLEAILPASIKAKHEADAEPSFASIAVEASLKRAMGMPLNPIEESLLP